MREQARVRRTVGQALVEFLAVQFAERDGAEQRFVPGVTGIFGHGNVSGLGQAIAQATDRLPYVQGRNEQSLVHLAAGFARESRRLATLAVTSSIGPGATNMVTGAALATINRLPVLLLPGDAYATRLQGSVLQQLEHPVELGLSVNDAFRPVSRFFDRISRPEQLLTALPEAIRILTSPDECGAAVLALPQDVQSEAYDYPTSFFEPRTWSIRRPTPDVGATRALARLLVEAERPLIIAGGGVWYSGAEEALERCSAAWGVPVTETFAGKGALVADSWRAMGGIGVEGNPGANALARQADLVIAVGTRLGDFITASASLFQDPAVRFAGVNVSGHDAAKHGALQVIGDARLVLDALADAAPTGVERAAWQAEAVAAKEGWLAARAQALRATIDGVPTRAAVLGLLNERARPGDCVVAAAGAPPGDLLKAWDASGGRRAHIEFGFSCMGYEIPGGLGARLARPAGEVVVLVGDGTYLMSPTELVTAAQEGLKVTVVVLDNHGFQVIRRLQMNRVGLSFGNEFLARSGAPLQLAPRPNESEHAGTVAGRLEGPAVTLDLAATARGFGVGGVAVQTLEDLERALDVARAATGTTVIVVEVTRYDDLPPSEAWWDVAPAEVSAEPETQARRADYEAARRSQRYYR